MSEELPGVVGVPEPKPPGEERGIREEKTRSRLTIWTLGIFAGTIAGGFIGVFTGTWSDAKELLDVTVPLESVLIGGIAGYYLGSNRPNPDERREA